jgi:hypothetical protein
MSTAISKVMTSAATRCIAAKWPGSAASSHPVRGSGIPNGFRPNLLKDDL